MQYKLLQFYKVLSNFSTNLISGFIPLIVYQETSNVYLAVASLGLGYVFNLIFNFLFKKFVNLKPELCLCLRVIPIIVMQIALVFISYSPILIMIVLTMGYGLNYTFKNIPSDIIYNYSVPANTSALKLGLSRAFEQMGYVMASVVGGLFLDYIPFIYVVVISLTLYLVASLPLMFYYIKNKGKYSFNTELVSNAYLFYESKDNTAKGKTVSKKIILSYFLYSALLTGVDAFYMMFGFATYLKTGSFLISGALCGTCDAIYGVMVLVAGKLDEKMDLTVLSCISCAIMSACIVGATLTIGTWPSFVFFLIIPIFWPFPNLFNTQRMFTKSKILGITNECTFSRYNALLCGQAFCYLFGLTGVVSAVFVVAAVLVMGSSITLPTIEEKTRKSLVDYIENNQD